MSAVVFDPGERKVIDSRTVKNGSFIETGNDWERIQDPAVIVSRVMPVLDGFLGMYPEVAGIGITGQMHGIVYTDKNGMAVSPLFTWQDGRGSIPENGTTLVDRIYRDTGVIAASGYGLVTHLYQSEHSLVPENAVSLCTIPDYIGMMLTGRERPLVHISMAASLGFFDTENMSFRSTEFAAAGGDTGILPEVTDEITVLGSYRGYPVTVAIGDNQASFLGAVGYSADTLLLNIGTGGQISILSDKLFEAPGIEARPISRGRYLLAGSSLCGGRAYAILEKFFRSYVSEACGSDEPQYETMERLAEKALDTEGGMTVRTAFMGTRTDPGLRGSITGISEDTFTPEGLIMGVMRGLIDELHEMYVTIRDGASIRAERLVGSGNGLRKNRILQRIASEAFGAELEMSTCNEEAACGAAVSFMNRCP